MYIKRECVPGLHMVVYTYDNKEEAEKMKEIIKCCGGFAKIEYDEVSNTWELTTY